MSDTLALKIPPREDARFGPLKAMLEANWEENSPKLFRALKKKGTLGQVLDSRVEQAILILHQCEVQGLAPDQARELAYEDLFLLPSEDEDNKP